MRGTERSHQIDLPSDALLPLLKYLPGSELATTTLVARVRENRHLGRVGQAREPGCLKLRGEDIWSTDSLGFPATLVCDHAEILPSKDNRVLQPLAVLRAATLQRSAYQMLCFFVC